jgi:hypothetical protein
MYNVDMELIMAFIMENNINFFLHMMDINAQWNGIYRPLGQETKYENDISSCNSNHVTSNDDDLGNFLCWFLSLYVSYAWITSQNFAKFCKKHNVQD